jgi:hypothetical protein
MRTTSTAWRALGSWLTLAAGGMRGLQCFARRVHRFLRPPWRKGGIVYPDTHSQMAPRPDERRRIPRHRVPSIMYVQLGSDNGGVVVNLGREGIACRAARKLTAEVSSILNLRLRGCGLSVDLVGELVWLGEERKEAGISFKILPENIQREISDWIAREALLYQTTESEGWPQPKPMNPMQGIASFPQKPATRSLSAALAASRATPADSLSVANAYRGELPSSRSLDAATGISGATPLPGTDSSIQPSDFPADDPASRAQVHRSEEIVPGGRDHVSRALDRWLETASGERWIPPALLAAWRRGSRLHKLLLAGTTAACIGIFVLIFILALAHVSLQRSAGNRSLQERTAQAAASSTSVGSPQAASIQPPASAPETARLQLHRPPASWSASLEEAIFGHEFGAKAGIDEVKAGVQVWTFKSSGYFYCADSSFYQTLQPGAFMTQGEALQSGYRPRLGQFCD